MNPQNARSMLLADYGPQIAKLDRMRWKSQRACDAVCAVYEQCRHVIAEQYRARSIYADMILPWMNPQRETLDACRREIQVLENRVNQLQKEAAHLSEISKPLTVISNRCTDEFMKNFPQGHLFGCDVKAILGWN